MRSAFLALCLLAPTALWAEDFPISSSISDVTVFPDGASVNRQVSYSIPAGQHRLILTDMPFVDPASLRLSTSAAAIAAVAYRDDYVPPRSDADSAAIQSAKDRIDAVQVQITDVDHRARAADLEAESARARITFLSQLGGSDSAGAADPQHLKDLLALVSTEGLSARQDAAAAEDRAAGIRKELKPLQEDLGKAQEALAALLNESEKRSYLTVNLEADAPATGTLTISYTTYDAGWQPAYDIALTTTSDTPALSIARFANVHQSTGENWNDVALTLSTARPSGQVQPGEVWPEKLEFIDPDQRPVPMVRTFGSLAKTADMAMEAAPVTAQAGSVNGITVTYDYPRKVSVANAADDLKLDLGTLEMAPDVYARAVPMQDSSAYLVAGITNDSGEMLLPSDAVQLFLDGTFVGRQSIGLLAEGDTADYGFGAIDGLRLERRVNDRKDGDRGILSKSNERREDVTLSVKNQTKRDWDVRLSDRVPYSEQDDLKIDWQADPKPDATDVDGKRGVLEWRFAVLAGATKDIALKQQITWPDGKVLNQYPY